MAAEATTAQAARATRKRKPAAAPTLRHERALSADGARWVIGCDEVGRGAIAGPVAVGLCVVDLATRVPKGLRDSKLLSEQKRTELHPTVSRWGRWSAVGMAGNDEIDRLGLTAALGLAAVRAARRHGHSDGDADFVRRFRVAGHLFAAAGAHGRARPGGHARESSQASLPDAAHPER